MRSRQFTAVSALETSLNFGRGSLIGFAQCLLLGTQINDRTYHTVTEKIYNGKDSHNSIMPVLPPLPTSDYHLGAHQSSVLGRGEVPFQLGLQNRLRIPKDVLGIQDSLEPAQPLDQASTKIQLVCLLSGIRRIDVVEIRRVLWEVIRHGVVELVDKGQSGLGERLVKSNTAVCRPRQLNLLKK